MDYLSELYTRLRAAAPGMELRQNEPMSRHVTFKVGGPAALMALPNLVSLLLLSGSVSRAAGRLFPK